MKITPSSEGHAAVWGWHVPAITIKGMGRSSKAGLFKLKWTWYIHVESPKKDGNHIGQCNSDLLKLCISMDVAQLQLVIHGPQFQDIPLNTYMHKSSRQEWFYRFWASSHMLCRSKSWGLYCQRAWERERETDSRQGAWPMIILPNDSVFMTHYHSSWLPEQTTSNCTENQGYFSAPQTCTPYFP